MSCSLVRVELVSPNKLVLSQGGSMGTRNTPTTERRASRTSVSNFEAARIKHGWEARVKSNPKYAQLEGNCDPGKCIISQGDIMDNPVALYVIEGSVYEMLCVEHGGHRREEVVNEIRPGGLAFTQALFEGHADKPAHLSLIASSEGVRFARYSRNVLSKVGISFNEITAEFQRALQFMEFLRKSWAREMELQGDIDDLDKLLKAAEIEAREQGDLAYEEFDRAETHQQETIKQRQLAEEIGRQNRSLTEELETRFEVMKLQIVGWEIFKARMATALREQGVDPQSATPQAEEEALISGRMPEGMSYENLRFILARYHDAIDIQEDEVADAVDALQVQPKSTPPSIKPVTVPPRPTPKSEASSPDPLTAEAAQQTAKLTPPAPSDEDAAFDFEVVFTSEVEGDDGPEAAVVSKDPRDTISYEEGAFPSEAPTALSVQNGSQTEEEKPRRRDTIGFGDLRSPVPSAPVIPLTQRVPFASEPDTLVDNAGDTPTEPQDEMEDSKDRKTKFFDPYDNPNVAPPSRDAILPQPPSQPPLAQRPPGWKPPPPAHPGVRVPSADPDKPRKKW